MEHTEDPNDDGEEAIFGTHNSRLERIGSIAGVSVGSTVGEPYNILILKKIKFVPG